MLTLKLEPTDSGARPAFKTPNECKKWLDQFQLTNVQAAHAALRGQLAEFNRCAVRGMDRLQVLEMLRETVAYAQNDFGKRVAGKPLPLDDNELAFLSATTGLWHAMFDGYLRCLLAYQDGDKQLASYGALLCHRCMLFGGNEIFEYQRAGYELDGLLWQQMHALFAYAEEEGLLSAAVEDEQNKYAPRSSCHDIYLKNLLASHAHPQELTRTQQQLMDIWLTRWVPSITIDRTCAISKGDAPPLAIDLSGTQCLQTVRDGTPASGDNMRFLAMVPLSKLMRVKTILLQQGHTPKQVELEGGADNLACIELLTYLHRQWCESRPERAHDRYGAAQEITLSYGPEGSYSAISGRQFDPRNAAVQETWHTEDISMLGARMMRSDINGVRLAPNRLIAARMASDEAFRIGVIVWVNVMRTGQLRVGVRFLPGVPQAFLVQDAVTLPGAPKTRSAALLLPALENLGIPASLILPRNAFKPEHVLEASITGSNQSLRFKLKFSVERGGDYERVSFAPA